MWIGMIFSWWHCFHTMLTVALLFVLFDKKTMELFINVNCFVIRATTHLMGVWIIIEVSYLFMKKREGGIRCCDGVDTLQLCVLWPSRRHQWNEIHHYYRSNSGEIDHSIIWDWNKCRIGDHRWWIPREGGVEENWYMFGFFIGITKNGAFIGHTIELMSLGVSNHIQNIKGMVRIPLMIVDWYLIVYDVIDDE